jgi:hypothetical protein
MKILFLDIDGVLNSAKYLNNLPSPIVRPDMLLDPVAISRLNQITDATGAHIVVSSDWRLGYVHQVAELRGCLSRYGITGKVLHMTPVNDDTRGQQIQQWLDTTPRQIDAYVILDDKDTDDMTSMKNFIQTTFKDGLQDVHVQQAIAILNKTRTET